MATAGCTRAMMTPLSRCQSCFSSTATVRSAAATQPIRSPALQVQPSRGGLSFSSSVVPGSRVGGGGGDGGGRGYARGAPVHRHSRSTGAPPEPYVMVAPFAHMHQPPTGFLRTPRPRLCSGAAPERRQQRPGSSGRRQGAVLIGALASEPPCL